MNDRNEAEERLYSAFGRQWTIETGRTVNPDGTVTTESVTVEATVEAIKAAERQLDVDLLAEAERLASGYPLMGGRVPVASKNRARAVAAEYAKLSAARATIEEVPHG